MSPRRLTNAIEQNRIAHAYLFVGPRGTGKTTIARIFAKCLNCTGGPKVDFDDDDPRCQEIAEGRSLDVLEIDGASNRGIEEIRELRETVKYAPAASQVQDLHHRRSPHAHEGGLQRAAQDARRAARACEVHVRHHGAGEGAADHPLPLPAV